MTGRARANQIHRRGEVESRGDAGAKITMAGDVVVVNRGQPRSVVMACPDGCGEILTINLDPRAGPAWRLYDERRGMTLFPSIWRETGCESHFILWRDSIYWCGPGDDWPAFRIQNDELDARVLGALPRGRLTPYSEIAEALDEIPWEVLAACQRLARVGKARSGEGRQSGSFKRLQ